jgi:hypothetical protein
MFKGANLALKKEKEKNKVKELKKFRSLNWTSGVDLDFEVCSSYKV